MLHSNDQYLLVQRCTSTFQFIGSMNMTFLMLLWYKEIANFAFRIPKTYKNISLFLIFSKFLTWHYFLMMIFFERFDQLCFATWDRVSSWRLTTKRTLSSASRSKMERIFWQSFTIIYDLVYNLILLLCSLIQPSC